MAAILLAGIVAYRQLPVSALPEVDYPTIQVITFYPGASPDVMATAVTAPLERQFGQVPGLNQMTSTSSGGSSIITLQFDLNLNIDVAEQEVQAAINAAFLPLDLPTEAAPNQMGGQPVKDVEMEFAPSHVRTRRLVRRTALRKRLVRVNSHSVNALSADSFWVPRSRLNRPFKYLSH